MVIVAELQSVVPVAIHETQSGHGADVMSQRPRETIEQAWFSPVELARLIGRTSYTVRQWCRLGRLKARKRACGRGSHLAWEIPVEELQHYRNHGIRPADMTGAFSC